MPSRALAPPSRARAPHPPLRSVVVVRSLARRVLRGQLASLASAIPRAACLPALALFASLSRPAPPNHACASRPLPRPARLRRSVAVRARPGWVGSRSCSVRARLGGHGRSRRLSAALFASRACLRPALPFASLPPPTPRPHCASLPALRNLALSSPRPCPALPCAAALPPLRPPGVSASFRRGDPVRPPPLAPPSSLRVLG